MKNYSTTALSWAITAFCLSFGTYVQAQVPGDVNGISARLVELDANTLEMQLRANAPWDQSDGIVNLTFAIRWDASVGGALGDPSQFALSDNFCMLQGIPLNANPGIVNVDSDGFRYRGYNANGNSFPAACSFPADQWVPYAHIPVSGIGGCTTFEIVSSDAYTSSVNSDWFISIGGTNITGNSPVIGPGVQLGECDTDCEGTVGGTVLPGSPCDDGDPCTTDDVYNTQCDCAGTPASAPSITSTTSNDPICSDETLSLSVTATSGTGTLTYSWAGTGTFSPNAQSASVTVTGAATGDYVITVSNGCATTDAIVAVTVDPVPAAPSTGSYGPLCSSDAPIALGGSPAGGTWSGTGVSGSAPYTFDPSAGTQELTYTVGSGDCTNSATTTITVNEQPASPTPGSYGPLCSNDGAIALGGTPAGGVWTGAGVSAGAPYTFDPSAGTQTLTYTIGSGDCSNSATTTITVNAQPAAPSTGSYGPLCSDADPVPLNGTPDGGVWTGNGVSASAPYTFDPSVGTQLLTYTITIDGCTNSSSTTVSVAACDCAGVVGGSAFIDDCGACVGGTTGELPCGDDCAGVPGGSAFIDQCGDCAGGTTGVVPNESCTDCAGIINGSAFLDECGVCVGGTTGEEACVQDCLGIWGGDAEVDDCNVCYDAGPSNPSWNTTCLDCNGVVNGSAFIDDCNVCVGGNTGLTPCGNDCAGIAGGTAYFDNCGDCVGGTTGAVECEQDCNNVWGGTAFLDDCGDCVGGNTGADPCEQDCEGVYGGPAVPGTSCDPGPGFEPGSGTWDILCDCVGGTPVGTFDCPDIQANFGDECDPGPGFENGQINTDCLCEGTPITVYDCPDIQANFGDECDPGPGFVDGQINIDCVCEGTPVTVYDCPDIQANFGDPCDAGPLYVPGSGVITNDCLCVGTPVGDCTEVVTLELQTDANGSQTSWEILAEGSMDVMCDGAGYPNNSVVTNTCCLPEGCYLLRVYDSAGDGMASGTNGGYILRTFPENDRIIDNRNNFLDGSVSAIANNRGFCLPIGDDRLIFTHCDKLYWESNEFLVASLNPAVSAEWIDGAPNSQQDANSGYQFWFFDPNGSYSFIWFRRHSNSHGFGSGPARAAHLRINNWLSTYHIPENVMMNVRVRGVVNGVPMEWGPACRFMIDPVAAACPPTKLMDIPYNQYLSCGQTREFALGSYVTAIPVSGANQYEFRFRQPGEGFEVIKSSTTYHRQLWWNEPILEEGTQYEVDVRAMVGGVWCDWGEICTLNISSNAQGGGASQSALIGNGTDETAELNLWPNPNRGDELYISLSVVPEGVLTVSVDIFDLFGKRVMARTLAANDGFVNTVLDLESDLAGGLYMVNITAGEKVHTQRLMIQR